MERKSLFFANSRARKIRHFFSSCHLPHEGRVRPQEKPIFEARFSIFDPGEIGSRRRDPKLCLHPQHISTCHIANRGSFGLECPLQFALDRMANLSQNL